jgi:hypothetical protein
LYDSSVDATATICWPVGVLVPTQAFSKPSSSAFASAIACVANAQLIAPLATLNSAASSWC